LLKTFNALEPKTNQVLLAYYEEKLSTCSGRQYAAAVEEIKALIEELQNAPNQPLTHVG
jgi:thiaminase